MKKIAAYCRFSHSSQRHDSQKAEIQKWFDNHGVDPKQVEWYLDKETGKHTNRPAFERLQKDIFDGKVQQVVLWKLDRLSRRLVDGVNILAGWCERGLKIVVVTQQLEFNGPVGKTLAAVMLGLAEIEMEYRHERQMAGIEVAKQKGRYKGRKPGTTKKKPERAMELRGKGLTVEEIATALGVSERTVFRYIGREAA